MTAQLASLIQNAVGPDYRIEHELEGGGMSRLFLATDLRHDRRVVIKVLAPELITSTSAARFKREIALTVKLQHPHILPILTSGSFEDVLYYITPYIPGESLRARIEREGKLPLDDIVKILRDVSGALAFAHAKGVAHRDVKPGNILLADGHAILADFGIARAIGTTQGTPITTTGVVVGTPAYMAPELPTDEKADVYALGVVAYEMLCGALPHRGTTVRTVHSGRGAVVGDDTSRLDALANWVAGALAPSREDRRATIEDLNRCLIHSRARAYRWTRAVAVSAAAFALLVVALVARERRQGQTLDAGLYAVAGDPGPNDTLTAEFVDALAQWRDIRVIESGVDAGGPSSSATVPSRGRLVDGARRVHARYLIYLSRSDYGDGVRGRAYLYDAARDSLLRTAPYAFPALSISGARQVRVEAMWRLANALLREGTELPLVGRNGERPSFIAWRAYDSGRIAIASWNLDSAVSSLRIATQTDPTFSRAELWLAQALSWRNSKGAELEIETAATHSLELGRGFNSRDSLRARALLALARGELPQSRADFLELVTDSSADAGAWIGLGDCEVRDSVVLRDRRSPSGWSFRSSYEAAARSYLKAADAAGDGAPSNLRGWLLGRLSKALPAFGNQMRLGQGLPPDTTNFVAFPYESADTLAFAPYPLGDASRGRFDPPQAAIQAALSRNRAIVRRAAEEWVRREPRNAAALDSLATWAELTGGAAEVGDRRESALAIASRAQALSSDETERRRLMVALVRLRFKSGDFSGARREADSLLRDTSMYRVADVQTAALAAMVGRLNLARRLGAQEAFRDASIVLPTGGRAVLPPQLLDAAGALAMYSAGATAPDSVQYYGRLATRLVSSYFADSAVARLVRSSNAISVPLTLAYPSGREILAAVTAPPDEVTRVYVELARTGQAPTLKRLESAMRFGAGKLPGSAVDGNLRRARLWLIGGDTTRALSEIDPVLDALPALSPVLFSQPQQLGSLVRLLALRAVIAARQHDTVSARKFARAVIELWSGGDQLAEPLVSQMLAVLK